MKKAISLFVVLVLALALSACGAKEAPQQTQEPPAPASVETPAPAAPVESPAAEAEAQSVAGGGTLVVYFSATGTTKGVAEKIAAQTGADVYEILAAEPYSDADLNWHDSGSRTTKEQNDKSVRPQIASETLVLDGYATIYIGYPIWWGEEPRIMDTFAESYDFTGKTMIPFCTSSSSGIGSSGRNLEKLTNGATWLDGKRFGGNVSDADLQSWIDSLQ